MKRIAEKIKDGATLVSDGAWGTLLQLKGMEPGECPELWCVEHRADVLGIAKEYVSAGSDMIKTNSFGGSRFKLEVFGLHERTTELNEAAAAISREAAGQERHVIASVGPTGKLLVMGDVSESELYDAFCEQLTALEQGGADACCIETMSAIDEATQAIKAAKENTSLEVICTFTFEKTQNGEYRTMMGVSPSEMAHALGEAGADIIGTNCGNGIAGMIDIVQEIRAVDGSRPILVHANAGLPASVEGKDVFPETPAMTAKLVPELLAAGAAIVGGCCGTTPEHISAIVAVIKEQKQA